MEKDCCRKVLSNSVLDKCCERVLLKSAGAGLLRKSSGIKFGTNFSLIGGCDLMAGAKPTTTLLLVNSFFVHLWPLVGAIRFQWTNGDINLIVFRCILHIWLFLGNVYEFPVLQYSSLQRWSLVRMLAASAQEMTEDYETSTWSCYSYLPARIPERSTYDWTDFWLEWLRVLQVSNRSRCPKRTRRLVFCSLNFSMWLRHLQFFGWFCRVRVVWNRTASPIHWPIVQRNLAQIPRNTYR